MKLGNQIHGLIKRKNSTPARKGRLTLNSPLELLAEFVTSDQLAGGVRFLADHNLQSLAQSGQPDRPRPAGSDCHPPGASYTWITSTNVAAPLATWTTNSTGVFDGSGSFSNAFPINTSVPARFLRLKTP